MSGNPLALLFLLLAVVLFGLTILFVVLQKRMLRDQARAVSELLDEARRMRRDESVEPAAPGDDAGDPEG